MEPFVLLIHSAHLLRASKVLGSNRSFEMTQVLRLQVLEESRSNGGGGQLVSFPPLPVERTGDILGSRGQFLANARAFK